MSYVDFLTPKDTEELKPGLFIQKKVGVYRQVYPAGWKGKIIWKNMLFGGSPIKSLIFFAIILFVIWSYNNDVAQYKEFYERVYNNPVLFCSQASVGILEAIECTPDREKNGLCQNTQDILGNYTFPTFDG